MVLVALLDLAGFALVEFGLWQIFQPAAFIVGGTILLIAARRISAQF